jgi:tRNA 2-thiouridine synthesizing protein A
MEGITPDEVLDCRGLSCPMPMLKLKKAAGGLKSGQVLQMMGTDPGTKNDIAQGVGKFGCEYLGSEDEEGHTSYYVKKS